MIERDLDQALEQIHQLLERQFGQHVTLSKAIYRNAAAHVVQGLDEFGRTPVAIIELDKHIDLRAPWWAGKDVVGYLRRKGWKVEERGLVLNVRGEELFIPAQVIIDSGPESAEVTANRLDLEARGEG